jgi:hypothetical protein
MTTAIPVEDARPAKPSRARPRLAALSLPAPDLAVLLVLAAVLNLWALSTSGMANE